MNRNYLRYSLLPFVYLLLTLIVRAQQFPCGTTVSQAQQDFEAALADTVSQVIELNRTFHLAVFITEDNDGETNVDPAEITKAISELNTAFERIKVTFALHSLSYIDNYHFDEIHLENNEKDLITQNNVRNLINLFLVFHLYNEAGQEICGYTYFPSDSTDAILLNKACLNGTFLTAQIGHFFNLYHTHETSFGIELVARSNCQTAGDLCCDTPADPDLTLNVSPDCQYTGKLKDASGDYYITTTANYMSSSPLDCRCYFSDKQYRRMINCMLQVKDYLW
ncbi:MAG: hypothetical protein JXR41_02115 [Bacteroidales bacterium]|nr:hypothetical protein [Bacteroidales bacterium]MBN2761857.1 hypothetical protein [Bacteroidales bacterium]